MIWEKEVYAHFGLTFSCFGSIEHGLANVLALRLTDSERQPSRQAFDRHLDNCFKLTLGNLRSKLAKFYSDHEVITRIDAAKKHRDFLAHHFFRERAEQMFSPDGMKRLLVELSDVRQEIDSLDHMTSELADQHLEKMGVDVDEFRKAVQERGERLVRQAQEQSD